MFCGIVMKCDGWVGLGYLLNNYGMVKVEVIVVNILVFDWGLEWVWYGFVVVVEFYDMDWLMLYISDNEDV